MREYTKEERREIHTALKSAVSRLWDGRDATIYTGEEFICLAMCVHPGKALAAEMIEKRLVINGDKGNTVQCWLHKMGYIPENPVTDEKFHVKLQAYRLAWLKELIAEFAE